MCEYTTIMLQHLFTVTTQYTHYLLFLTQTPVSTTVPSANPLNDDTPADEISFAAEYNSSAALYADALEMYINEVAKLNNNTLVADKLITLVQTGSFTLQNATILGISVFYPPIPAQPTPPAIPPLYADLIKNVTLVNVSDPSSSITVHNGGGGGNGGEISFSIITRLNVSKQPEQEVCTHHPTHIHKDRGGGGRKGGRGMKEGRLDSHNHITMLCSSPVDWSSCPLYCGNGGQEWSCGTQSWTNQQLYMCCS